MSLEAYGHTDIGRERDENQDNYLCLELEAPGAPVHLLAVADGMGGHGGGQTASDLAIARLRRSVTSDCGASGAEPESTLAEAFAKANREVLDHAKLDPELKEMGTTLVAALVAGGSATVANVGDSRGYLVRGGELHQLTRDHSWLAEEGVRLGMKPEEMESSPFAGMITRCLGFESGLETDLFDVELENGDYLLLCSDGLTGMVPEAEILAVVQDGGPVDAICRELISRANAAGGHDNVTCVVAHYRKDDGGSARDTRVLSLDMDAAGE